MRLFSHSFLCQASKQLKLGFVVLNKMLFSNNDICLRNIGGTVCPLWWNTSWSPLLRRRRNILLKLTTLVWVPEGYVSCFKVNCLNRRDKLNLHWCSGSVGGLPFCTASLDRPFETMDTRQYVKNAYPIRNGRILLLKKQHLHH